ncbi:hypothetical protein JJB98_22775 [Bradyrhizobium diazoefficiens]|nr:hypothetical protein [Bradyrhizobium diazoefficiens]QQO24831.1 hypothetical protein JJB98_22775 [Bradyrhizobium diazoefficiens]
MAGSLRKPRLMLHAWLRLAVPNFLSCFLGLEFKCHLRPNWQGTVLRIGGCPPIRNPGEDQNILHESLEEEKEADAMLTMLAKGEVNLDALAA